MSYTEVQLFGRTLRVYDEDHIECEFGCIKDNWRKLKIGFDVAGYKYIRIYDGKNRNIKIHRIVFLIHNPSWDINDSSTDNSIDHINGNPLDNRIENLRCVTNQENQFNTKAKGYSWDKSRNKWQALIKINYKTIHLGSFVNEEDARNAYLIAKAKFHVITPKTF